MTRMESTSGNLTTLPGGFFSPNGNGFQVATQQPKASRAIETSARSARRSIATIADHKSLGNFQTGLVITCAKRVLLKTISRGSEWHDPFINPIPGSGVPGGSGSFESLEERKLSSILRSAGMSPKLCQDCRKSYLTKRLTNSFRRERTPKVSIWLCGNCRHKAPMGFHRG